MRISVYGVTSDFDASEEVVGLHSTQGKTAGTDFIRHYYIIFRSIIRNYLCSLWAHLLMTHFLRLALKWNGVSSLRPHARVRSPESINTVSLHYSPKRPNWQSTGI
jgi:hypothetical protein